MSNNGVDVAQLQREYRNMENNRKMYTEESQVILRRQSKIIEKLRDENEALKHSIALENTQNEKLITSQQQEEIIKLQDAVDNYSKKIAGENKQLVLIQQQTKLMRHKVLHQRKHLGGVNASKENHQMINKQIRILENRLDKALTKFNEALANNKELRDTIDGLRRERVVFDNIYRKLERELLDKKKQMGEIIEASNLAYEQRDVAQMEIASIEQMNRNEKDEFEKNMQDMTLKIENHKKIYELERSGAVQEGNPERALRGELSVAEEKALKQKFHKGQWGVAKEKIQIQASQERVQNFEQAFQQIQEATGIQDLRELVQKFIKREDENFSLFNYVTEQGNEIEKLEEQLQALKTENAKFTQESGEDFTQQKQLLSDLETRLTNTDALIGKFERKAEEAQTTLNSVKVGIQSIFSKIQCNSPAVSGDGVVTELNMMNCLGVIEQRANDLLQRYATKQQSKMEPPKGRRNSDAHKALSAANTQMVLGNGPSTPMGHDQIQINPPNLDDYSSNDDSSENEQEDSRPFTRDELKLRTLKGLQKRTVKEKPSTIKIS